MDLEAKKDRVLLVMSDAKFAFEIKKFLEAGRFLVDIEPVSESVLARILGDPPALILLELDASQRYALEICRELRGVYDGGIVFISTRRDEIDEIVALELGADEFFDVSSSLRVLQARLNAFLRRRRRILSLAQNPVQRYRAKPKLELDLVGRQLILNAQVVSLSACEFKLLYFFICNAGVILTREALCRQLLGRVWDGRLRNIDLQVSRLRTVLGDSGKSPHFIRSIRGTGYYFSV